MPDSLHTILENDQPTEFKRIERALAGETERTEDQEVAMSALVWSRCVFDGHGMLATVLNHTCAQRIDVLSDHLGSVGDKEAASAVNDLRDAIPLDTSQVQAGLIYWIETEDDVKNIAERLEGRLEDIRPLVWEFMRDLDTDIPDVELPTSGVTNAFSTLQNMLSWRKRG